MENVKNWLTRGYPWYGRWTDAAARSASWPLVKRGWRACKRGWMSTWWQASAGKRGCSTSDPRVITCGARLLHVCRAAVSRAITGAARWYHAPTTVSWIHFLFIYKLFVLFIIFALFVNICIICIICIINYFYLVFVLFLLFVLFVLFVLFILFVLFLLFVLLVLLAVFFTVTVIVNK